MFAVLSTGQYIESENSIQTAQWGPVENLDWYKVVEQPYNVLSEGKSCNNLWTIVRTTAKNGWLLLVTSEST